VSDGLGTFDFVIIGAGSAGCVLADHLSRDPQNSVLLLEAGKRVRNPLYRMPMLPGHLLKLRKNNWYYSSTPQPALNGTRIFLPMGKLVGGSFRINGAQYVRGNPADYDDWAKQGNYGWSYSEVLPYFTRIEGFSRGKSSHHGVDGPLSVSHSPELNAVSKAFLKATGEAGYDHNDDFNGPRQRGFGPYDFNQRGGRKWTTADSNLLPALKRRNLRLEQSALATRILLHDHRAAGVEFEQDGQIKTVNVRREVILSAGAANSPQLLMLSGIGDPAQLREFGIASEVALPGVGKGLQDHLNTGITHKALQPVTLARTLRLDRLSLAVARALLTESGPVARSALETGGFFSLDHSDAGPEFQVVFIPLSVIGAAIRPPWSDGLDAHGYTAIVWPNRPESRGEVRLQSRDPHVAPLLDPKYLDVTRDLELTRDGFKELRRIMDQPALQPYRGREVAPGTDVKSDDEIDDYIRTESKSGYHPSCSARMGVDDLAVVDPELRVRGVAGLRIADASVMPAIVTGNTNATTIMIADKASDMILGKAPLPASHIETARAAPQSDNGTASVHVADGDKR
jgi:choline dehydrogenase